MQHLEESVVFQTLFYAQTFQQGLTLTQLWQRLLVGKKELTFEEFIAQLQQLQAQGFIQEKNKRYFYLLQEKSVNSHKIWQKKYTLATQAAAKIIHLPFVKAIGLTGSLAAVNCRADDDLDFLIITKADRVYCCRFFCYLLASLLRKKNNHHRNNSWCFNVFLSEDELIVPPTKRTLYSAYQLKLLKPLIDRESLLAQLRQSNSWLNRFFNQQIETKIISSPLKQNFLGDQIEKWMRRFQFFYMKNKITREIVTGKQIFFHPLSRGVTTLPQLRQKIHDFFKQQQVTQNLILPQFLREKNDKIGQLSLITGVFDLLQTQHRYFIQTALRKAAGTLYIGLESDLRVQQLKGQKRPIYNQGERWLRLQNLFPQAKVFILPDNFGQKEIRLALLSKLKVQTLFVSDHDSNLGNKRQLMQTIAGKVSIIPEKKSISMTKILKQPSLSRELLFTFDQQQVQQKVWQEV